MKTQPTKRGFDHKSIGRTVFLALLMTALFRIGEAAHAQNLPSDRQNIERNELERQLQRQLLERREIERRDLDRLLERRRLEREEVERQIERERLDRERQ